TAALLRGFPVFDDGLDGERVTPTGAAILSYLAPAFGAGRSPRVLLGQGYGFGTKVFPGLSNVLRISVFEDAPRGASAEPIGVCEFEVDDQTPEDLAVALDRLRELSGVLDVLQSPVFGKKGRLGAQVRVLALLSRIDAIIDRCLIETTTLGVRWYAVNRRTLAREIGSHTIEGAEVQVKRAHRPDATVTRKAEMDDLASTPGGHAGRERLRQAAHQLDQETSGDDPLNSETEQ
ncbi:MAG: nickel insertion protein, partial [Thiohalocapsa sp.]